MRQRSSSNSSDRHAAANTRKARSTSGKTRSTGNTRSGTRGTSHRRSHGRRKWSAGVHTESTYPQEGLFKKDAATIARSLASRKVSPKGPASGMRMLTFYVNRAGKNLSASRRRVLERAKELLHEKIETARSGRTAKSKGSRAHRSTAKRAGTSRTPRSRSHR